MECFCLSYYRNYDDYFDPSMDCNYLFENGFYEGRILDRWKDYDDYLDLFNNLRKIIKRDFENILESRIRNLNNNTALVQEFNTVINTIDNGIDFDFLSGYNYAFLTDNYLCFNNFENHVDELELGTFGEDAHSCETIIILDCHLKSFYFIRTTKKVLSVSQSTTINAYYIKDKNIKRGKLNIKGGLSLKDCTDEGIQNILKLIK